MSETTPPSPPLITFIGAGNMAGAIIRGLVNKGYPTHRLRACAPGVTNLRPLKDLGVSTSHDNRAAIKDADVIVLGVKPQLMQTVCEDLRQALTDDTPLVISLAAGIHCASIRQWLGRDLAIIRSMSNTPAQIGLGASGLYATPSTSAAQRDIAQQILASVGITQWVAHEHLIDSVTALAGSGPAYFFLFIEAMIDTATDQGMDPETAKALALQTARGAVELASASAEDLRLLRARVTSPKGTTEEAIGSFERDDLRTTVKNAMNACRKRAQELANQ